MTEPRRLSVYDRLRIVANAWRTGQDVTFSDGYTYAYGYTENEEPRLCFVVQRDGKRGLMECDFPFNYVLQEIEKLEEEDVVALSMNTTLNDYHHERT